MTLLYILENLVFPPAISVLLILLGLAAITKQRNRMGFYLIAIAMLMLYVASIPVTALITSNFLEQYPPLDKGNCEADFNAQAIVVLGYTRDEKGREFGGPVSSGAEMERLRYAAYLYQCHHLPVFVIGGDALNTGIKEAELMKHTLETYFHVPVAAGDGRSRHTWDNAAYAREILNQKGIDSILLVTHAWHMARSTRLFSDVGFSVQPAPTGFTNFNAVYKGVGAWIPSATALSINKRLAHEIVGLGFNMLNR